jgi:Domain of unknown function (DUF222)
MTGDDQDDLAVARDTIAGARRDAAAALARLAEAAVRYADARIADDTAAANKSAMPKRTRAKPGEFVADELALMLREQPYTIRCLLARSRRVAAGLPTAWEAFRRGELDGEQIRVIDRAARKVTEAATLAAIDDQVVEAAQTRSPRQLAVWLLRLIVQLEPLAFEERHRRALAERRVTVVQGVDGMGYVTGEVSATDAAAIDAMLAATARSFGADDPRTEQQRRSDLFADLLLGRLAFDGPDTDNEDDQDSGDAGESDATEECEWLEVENIDPDTGELLGTQLQPVNADGEPIGEPIDPTSRPTAAPAPKLIKRPRTIRIGVIVPLASLLGASDCPGELTDRSAFVPGEALKQLITETLDLDSGNEVLFTPCSPTTTAGSSTPSSSAATPRPGWRRRSRSAPAPAASRRAPCLPTAATSIITNRRPTAPPPEPTWTRFADATTAVRLSPGMPRSETATAWTGPCPTPNNTDASTNHYPQDALPEAGGQMLQVITRSLSAIRDNCSTFPPTTMTADPPVPRAVIIPSRQVVQGSPTETKRRAGGPSTLITSA